MRSSSLVSKSLITSMWAALIMAPSCDETARVIGLFILIFVVGIGISVLVLAVMAARMAIRHRTGVWIGTALVYGLACLAGAAWFVLNDDIEPVPMSFLGAAALIAFGGAGYALKPERPDQS